METVVTVSFKEPAKTYEVLSTLKRESFNILTAGILEKENGVVTAKDGFNYDTDGDNWAIGGLWGSLIGIIGGPLGILFGAGLGMMIGDLTDIDELSDKADTIKEIGSHLDSNVPVLVLLIQEMDSTVLDEYLLANGAAEITRESLASIQEKIEAIEEAQKHLEEETKKKIREQKKQERKEKVDAKIAEIKERFANI